jgi:hypothetical protein
MVERASMPTNRTRIQRPLRRPHFSEEVLTLFWELEHTPNDHKSKQLALALNLWEEWWLSGCHVNDKSKLPPWPKGYAAHDDWVKTRATRDLLLQAVKDRPPPRLTEAETDAIHAAAKPLPVERREPFLQQVATSLQARSEPGPGDVHRAIVDAQRRNFNPPNLDRMNGTTKYDLQTAAPRAAVLKGTRVLK